MTKEQRDHCEYIIDTFTTMYRAKYKAGVEEHGGKLWEKNTTTDKMEEVADMFGYAVNDRDRMTKLEHEIDELKRKITNLDKKYD